VVAFRRAVYPALRVVVSAFVLLAVAAAPASAEGPAIYEMSFGSYGGEEGQFLHPAGIEVDAEGNAWVVDMYNNRVEKFDEAGEYLSQFGSEGFEDGEFNRPTSIAIAPGGSPWVTDAENDRIQKFDAEGEFVKAVGSSGSGPGEFSGPEGIAVDGEGHIWVADTFNGRVQEFSESGEFIQAVGSYGSEEGQLGEPTDLDIGVGGDILVADWQNNRVSVFDHEGEFLRQFGSSGSEDGEFIHPAVIDVDVKGNVWVGDEGNNRVEKFNESGEYLGQFGSEGYEEGEFSFSYPFGIATDPGAHLWVADPNNSRVQRWTTAAVPVCQAGNDATDVNKALLLSSGSLECEGEEPLEFEIVSSPKHGEISGFNALTGVLTYTPDHGFAGLDSFEFAATNSLGKSAAKTFTIEVSKVPLGEGIVAAYSFNENEGETAYDVANGHDGEVSGPDWVQGKYGSALNFVVEDDEFADLVQVPSDPAFNLTEALTVEAWVRPRILSGYAPVVAKARGLYNWSYELAAGGEEWGTPGAFIFHEEYPALAVNGAEELPPETWSHLAMTYNGELMRLYVNGELTDTETSASPHSGEGWLNIGIGASTLFGEFDGKIDEVYIYDRALSGVDIEKDMETPIEGVAGSEDPEEPEEPGPCEASEVEVSGEATDPEVPGLNLNVTASLGTPPCADNGEQSRPAKIEVLIDEELVYSETRNCEGPPAPCTRKLDRRIQLPYSKLIGTHSIRVDVEDQLGNTSPPVEWSETTPEEGTIFDAEAEISKEKECGKPTQHGHALVGTKCADVIHPRAGITVYRGRGGDDKIFGGPGSEVIRGEGGNDTILAGRGSDKLMGEGGNDHLLAGSGDDRLLGKDDDDVLVGGPGADRIRAGSGDDFVRGGATIDKLDGGEDENTLSFADGVTPGFYLAPGSGPLTKTVPGFPAKHEERGVYVNLHSGTPIGDDGEIARYGGGADEIRADNFQNVIGTPFADLIVGSDEINEIVAGAGTDIVRGSAGNDKIFGGADQDYLDGGEGQSSGEIDGGPGEDTCLNAPGPVSCANSNSESELIEPEANTISIGVMAYGSESEQKDLYVRGTDEGDEITASWDSKGVVVTATGGGGDFDPAENEQTGCTIEESGNKAECPFPNLDSLLIYGGAGSDTLKVYGFPKEPSITLLGGTDSDHLFGGGTEDVLVDGPDSGDDKLNAGNGDDTIFSNEGKDKLLAGAGDDLFVSAELCDGDRIYGGRGSDNSNWAQLVGAEIEKENPEYPADIKDHIFETPVPHGAKVRIAGGSISKQGTGCGLKGSIAGVENLEGSSGPDVLVGDGGENVLLGRGGRDVLRGRAGSDHILANNRNPDGDTAARRRDLDKRIECGSGEDGVKLDPADKHHLKFIGLKGCEPNHAHVRPGTNYAQPEAAGEAPTEISLLTLDEEEIGAAADSESTGPLAFYRFDETSGTSAVNWADQSEEEGEEEAEEESEEEVKELEEEETEEEELGYEAEGEAGEDSEHPGIFENGAELSASGAMEESSAVHLDGTNDYVDLTSGWNPRQVAEYRGGELKGYSVEMWVKFDDGASEREELFSRSEDAKGLFLYRSADGRLNFSVGNDIESPTARTDEAVGVGEWHHVVASVAEASEKEETFMRALSFEGEESLSAPGLILYVDGFPYALGVGEDGLLPPSVPSAHNLVGARDGESGLTDWLHATVDDVAIYGEALSFGEVDSHLSVSEAEQPTIFLEPLANLEDTDEDGVLDSDDNCLEVANSEQDDSDFNGVGDSCEPEADADEDGVADETDNCPEDPNPLQEDINENEVGDVCEPVE
jgi:Ca2+-binding RTX toxin-like protein/DNA-binding beta-propeller fold protein YncE